MIKRISICLIILFSFLGFLFIFSPIALAQDCEEIVCSLETGTEEYLKCNQLKQQCLEQKIGETKEKQNTLKNTIAVINGQVVMQQLQINQTQSEIDILEQDINDLSTRISGIEVSLDSMSEALIQRATAQYKRSQINPFLIILNNKDLTQLIRKLKYLQLTQAHISDIMTQSETQRLNYDQQKSLKEEKQQQIESKQTQLEQEKRSLDQKKQEEQNLLVVTQNDEKKYQQLLAEAKAEIAALKSFSSSKGGGTVSAQNSPDGWYFSQRDERWASATIANSGESMMEVGCLIASTAMIKKKYGENINPITIAANESYFFYGTAYMLRPWPSPSGQHYAYTSRSQLDDKLNNGPVIAKLSAGPYGTHFIVIKEKNGSDYIIHDPWEGYDKNFSDYYNTAQIIEVAYLVGN